MDIIIFYDKKNVEAKDYAYRAKNVLEGMGAKAICFCGINDAEDILENLAQCDIVLIIGGDGTIMHYSKLACAQSKPVLGINSGRLGFLAGLEKSEINKLKNLITKDYKISKRMLLSAEIIGGEKTYTALNDVVVSRSSYCTIIDFKILRNRKLVCSFRADGVIIASPTGSTAYSLSAGGPIVECDMKCLIVTPICPHSLAARSIVFEASGEIEVNFRAMKKSEILVSCDGEVVSNYIYSGKIKVKSAKECVNMISMLDQDFYKNLDKKLISKGLFLE